MSHAAGVGAESVCEVTCEAQAQRLRDAPREREKGKAIKSRSRSRCDISHYNQ